MNTTNHDPYFTAKIVSSYVRHHRLGPDQLPELIASIHRALGQLGQPPAPEEARTPAVPVRRSVHRDYVVCLDCGYRGKTLRRHISVRHGLSREEYLQRWGLLSDHPLTAPAYSEQRSILAKELGLGRKSATPIMPVEMPPEAEMPVATEPEIPAPPARRTRTRSKRGDGGSAAEAAPPARRRRSRSRKASTPPDVSAPLPAATEAGTPPPAVGQ
jgi:predicted transcriptional regulator